MTMLACSQRFCMGNILRLRLRCVNLLVCLLTRGSPQTTGQSTDWTTPVSLYLGSHWYALRGRILPSTSQPERRTISLPSPCSRVPATLAHPTFGGERNELTSSPSTATRRRNYAFYFRIIRKSASRSMFTPTPSSLPTSCTVLLVAFNSKHLRDRESLGYHNKFGRLSGQGRWHKTSRPKQLIVPEKAA